MAFTSHSDDHEELLGLYNLVIDMDGRYWKKSYFMLTHKQNLFDLIFFP